MMYLSDDMTPEELQDTAAEQRKLAMRAVAEQLADITDAEYSAPWRG